MAILYMDPEGGNDSNDGSTFALRFKTITSGATAARIAPGDTIRVIGSPPLTDTGINATWTDLSPTVTLASALNVLITDCETAWTASANVTATASATRRTGSFSASLAIAAGFTTGKVAYFDLGSNQDYSAYQGVTFWIRTNLAFAGTVFELRLCSDTTGDVAVDTFAIEGNDTFMINGFWPVYADKGSALGSAIRSIAVYALTDPGTITLLIDNISTVKAKGSSQTDNLNLGSLISPGANGLWWAIRGINGTSVTLEQYPGIDNATASRGWAGTTGSYDLYKWETVKVRQAVAAFVANDTVQESGGSTAPVVLSGGWNRSDMSVQDSETWLDGKWGWTDSIYNGVLRGWWTLEKINFVRWNIGFRSIGTSVGWNVSGLIRGTAVQGGLIVCTGATDCTWGDAENTGGNGGTIECGGFRLTAGNITAISTQTVASAGAAFSLTGTSGMVKVGNVSARNIAWYIVDIGSATAAMRIHMGNVFGRTIGASIYYGTSSTKIMDIEVGDIDVSGCTASSTFQFPQVHGWRYRGGAMSILNGVIGILGYPQAEYFIKSITTSGNSTSGWRTTSGFMLPVSRARVKATNLTDTTPRDETIGVTGVTRPYNAWLAFEDYLSTADNHRVEYGGGAGSELALVTAETGANRHTASGLGWKLAIKSTSITATFPMRHVLGKIYVKANKQVTLRLWVNRSDTALTVRLVQPRMQVSGVSVDVVDTAAASASTWEELEIVFIPTESTVIYPELQAYGGSTHHVFFDDLTILSENAPFVDNFTNAGGADVDIAAWESVEQASGSVDWDYQTGTTNPSLSVSFTNDRVVLKSGFTGGAQYHCARVINPVFDGVNNYEVGGRIIGFVATTHSGIAARLQSGSQSGYVVRLGTNSGLSELVRLDSGTETVLDSAGLTGTFDATATLAVNGSTITWWTSASSFGSPRAVVDATYATGKPGVYMRSWVDVIGHQGEAVFVDDFEVTPL